MRGQIIGASVPKGGSSEHAVVWQHEKISALPGFPGDTSSAAAAINDSGEVVGWS